MLILVLALYAIYVAEGFLRGGFSKKPKVLWPCLVLFALGFAAQALHEANVAVPSPTVPIAAVLSEWFNLR